MAWTGEVYQDVLFVLDEEVFLSCRHSFKCSDPVKEIMYTRRFICDKCSEPTIAKWKQRQSEINFDDVLEKVKDFYQSSSK